MDVLGFGVSHASVAAGEVKADYYFRSVTTGKCYKAGEVEYLCPDGEREQTPGRTLQGVLEILYDYDFLKTQFDRDYLNSCPLRGTRRYFPLLPLAREEYLSPLLVGDTPLYRGDRIGGKLGLKTLYLKDETRNPSGSYKDRASILVAAKAREKGIETICTASTGNAATALACVCASQGLNCKVIVPASAPPAKLAQMVAYGAEVFPIRGTYDDAFDLSTDACKHFGWYNRNTAYNPFTIDGKRVGAFEIWEQLGYRTPDSVWIPVGDGVIVSGIAKGFFDLRRLGLIDRCPRLVAVQAEGSSALVSALERGLKEPEPIPGAVSIADSIVVESPRNGIMALRDIRESEGRGVIVSDQEILSAIALLGRTTGLFVEPSSASVVAGLIKEREAGRVEDKECAVLLLTGTGLKDIDSARKTIRFPSPIEADLEALAGRIRNTSG